MATTEYPHLLLDIEERVATITFDRPERRNAFNPTMLKSLREAFEAVFERPDVGCVVLTGAGRSFCAGADLGALASPDPSVVARVDLRDVHRITLAIRRLDKPIIAAVNGPAMGAGCDFALACDIRLAGESARFSETYIRLGIIPGNGGTYFLPRIVGVAKACELVFTGDVIDAQEALRVGLVSHVVADAELPAAARELAAKIAAGPSQAITEARRAIYRDLTRDLEPALADLRPAMERLRLSGDHLEGLRAQAERRRPVFQGR